MKFQRLLLKLFSGFFVLATGYLSPVSASTLSMAQSPLFIGASVPPMAMLVMARNHKLYDAAYDDASDLNNDGVLDVGYKPNIDYYGYFNSFACYDYDSTSQTFIPKSVKSAAEQAADIKTCNAGPGNTSTNYAGDWSGDFLNYVTMSRMDALRKVLFGGYRSVDTSSKTILQRVMIPQDAHTWGKEYSGYARDGYYISQYTPLQEPDAGRYDLFANTSLSYSGQPLMRVLENNPNRIWNWVAKERPEAADQCSVLVSGGNNVTAPCTSSTSGWELVPSSLFTNLKVSYYTTSPTDPGHPNNHTDFVNNLITPYAVPGNLIKTQSLSQISSSALNQDHFISVVTGTLTVPKSGDYTFAVDGDDAVEFIVKKDGTTDTVVAGWYGGHGSNNSSSSLSSHSGSIYLLAGVPYTIEYHHEEYTGGQSYALYWSISASKPMKDYAVNVQVCVPGMLESNCQAYPDGDYKPTGLLHDYGENDSILFGLLTGSYANNLDGGVLRKNVSSFQDEVNKNDGTYTNEVGIVKTIDRLRTVGYTYSSHAYECGWIDTRPAKDGECSMWGNPIAEMMYEAVRYFHRKDKPTPAFDYSSTDNSISDNAQLSGASRPWYDYLDLPKPTWKDPYDTSKGGQPWCSKPYMLVISDVDPNFDSDSLPGSSFSSFTGDLSNMDVTKLGDTITANETGVTGKKYIGQSGTNADSAPTPKDVTSLGNIRGLAPEEPTKQGSYYAASVAYYGWLSDIFNGAHPDQPTTIKTYSVALSSPLPRIKIPLAGNAGYITLVPFAKSVAGAGISTKQGDFQPTDQIANFFVESLTATSGKFLINFEDSEQGADYDMDAIAEYSYQLNSDNTVTISVDSLYAAGGIDQHMGYVISGTTRDGTYLVIKDQGGGNDIYFLDRPDGVWAGDPRGTDYLGYSSTRTFTPGANSGAGFLKDPLWYAAKWGGFDDKNSNNIPDQTDEWDAQNNNTQKPGSDGVPDNYFPVTNALGLKQQLSSAFNSILADQASSSTVTVNSGALSTDTLLFQATFNAQDWTGNVAAYSVNSDGTLGTEAWDLQKQLGTQLSLTNGFSTQRVMITYNPTSQQGVAFRWPSNPTSLTNSDLSSAEVASLEQTTATDPAAYGSSLLDYLRGDQSQEGDSSTYGFRTRSSVLGDIVDSDPLYVPQPGFFYKDTWPSIGTTTPPENQATQKYSDFLKTFQNRDPVLYFGANDGFLHAINAYKDNSNANLGPVRTGGGNEILAYAPAKTFSDLYKLANKKYAHQYYVDGSSAYGDAFFDSLWHTVLVGSLRAGGQGLFALDITDPKGIDPSHRYPTFAEGNASKLALWEFTDANDADLGYTFSKPVIVRMHNGKWAAVFGNGYNNTEADGHVSTTGDAVLYIVDIQTGAIIRKIDTLAGMAQDPTSQGLPNGLASPTVVDTNGDSVADYIYAGDLFGNLWKFDVTSADPAQWGSSFSSGGKPAPFFIAKDSAGHRLPITVKPSVGTFPDPTVGTGNYLVYFATGKYFETSDNAVTAQNTQSVFGVWDDGTNGASRSNMLQQKITKEVTQGSYEYRIISNSPIKWHDTSTTSNDHDHGWYLDLINTGMTTPDNQGERVVYNPVLRNDRLIFTTLIPSTDQCAAGGSGWLMELSAITGGQLTQSPFDVNNDNSFNANDMLDVNGDGTNFEYAGGARKSGGNAGILSTPAIIDNPSCPNGQCYENKFLGTSKGTVQTLKESSAASSQGRQSWREVY